MYLNSLIYMMLTTFSVMQNTMFYTYKHIAMALWLLHLTRENWYAPHRSS